MIATIVITKIMTMMTDGNHMMMIIVMITETGTKTPLCGQEHDDDNMESTS